MSWAARCVEEGSCQWREPHSGPPPDFPGPWRVNGWANVNSPGGHNISHTHAQRNWHWSACYYVDLPGLAPGRHTLFVESQDSSGNWGVPTEIFLTVQ